MNRNNKTIISIVSVVIAVVICFFGYNFYQKNQDEQSKFLQRFKSSR